MRGIDLYRQRLIKKRFYPSTFSFFEKKIKNLEPRRKGVNQKTEKKFRKICADFGRKKNGARTLGTKFFQNLVKKGLFPKNFNEMDRFKGVFRG